MADVDIIHLHWTAKWFDFTSFLQSIPESVPIIWSLHDVGAITGGCCLYEGCNGFETGCRKCPQLKSSAFSWMTRNEWCRKNAALRRHRHSLVANSNWTSKIARRDHVFENPENIATIFPSVDLETFQPNDKLKVRKSLGINEEEFVLGFGCAAITDVNKNFGGFLEIINGLETKRRTAVIVFGEGDVPDHIGGVKVYRQGPLQSEREIADLYSAMDLFYVTSKMETFCQVAIEAQACGTPVCAFNVGGISDAIEHQETGMLFEFGDINSMIKFTSQFRGDERMRTRMQAKGISRAREDFSVEKMCDSYLEVYEKALKS